MSTPLLDVTHTLTRDHLRMVNGTSGHEPPLLDILKSEISASSQVKAGGTAKTGVPIALDALVLWERINDTLRTQSPYGQHPAVQKADAKTLLIGWANHTYDPTEALRLYELFAGWVDDIYELLEPTKKIPMQGLHCPVCGNDRTVTEQEGEHVYRPAIVIYPEYQPITAVCTAAPLGVPCSGKWEGEELHKLSAGSVVFG